MTPKQKLYLSLCEQLSPLWQQDERLLETDPETWQLAREIDDFLCRYQDDDRVSVAQYARNISRLRALYVEPVALARVE